MENFLTVNPKDPAQYVTIPRSEYVELLEYKAAADLEKYRSKYWSAQVEIDNLKEQVRKLKGEDEEAEDDQA